MKKLKTSKKMLIVITAVLLLLANLTACMESCVPIPPDFEEEYYDDTINRVVIDESNHKITWEWRLLPFGDWTYHWSGKYEFIQNSTKIKATHEAGNEAGRVEEWDLVVKDNKVTAIIIGGSQYKPK